MRLKIAVAGALVALGSAANAEPSSELTALPSPEERQYPMAILGVQPGMLAEEAQALVEGRVDLELEPEVLKMSVTAPTGRMWHMEYPQRLVTAGIGPYARMGSDPLEEVGLVLATGAMEGRVLSITRSMRNSNNELPPPDALVAQLTETFGEPSMQENRGGQIKVVYAWGEDGKYTDLASIEREWTEKRGNRESIHRYTPCLSGGSSTIRYDFQYPRSDEPVMLECSAVFTMVYVPGASSSKISFALTDYDLVRQHRDEVDRQIVETLMGEDAGETKPSEIPL